MEEKQHYSPGLDGVIAAETHISYLDTQSSQILIRGYDLIELSETKAIWSLSIYCWRAGCQKKVKWKRWNVK